VFDQLKAAPSTPGGKNLQHELTKLQGSGTGGIEADALSIGAYGCRFDIVRR
jgi:hypothetical protein